MPLTLSLIKAEILSKLCSINFLMSVVEQLPRRIQITLGGKPKKDTRLLKSLSLVTIVNSFDLANSQTRVSDDLSRFRFCKCSEPANELLKYSASFGERFWSNSNLIMRRVQFFPYLQHNLNMPEYLHVQDKENHQGFPQNSSRMPNTPGHQQRLSAFPSRMVYHFFFQVPKLFFHLVTWQYFFVQKYKKNNSINSACKILPDKDFVKWVAIAFVIATPIAYYAMIKWLENFAYKTSMNWWIFALAGLLALGIALLTVSWQSWRQLHEESGGGVEI
jgi:hypothetical protein